MATGFAGANTTHDKHDLRGDTRWVPLSIQVAPATASLLDDLAQEMGYPTTAIFLADALSLLVQTVQPAPENENNEDNEDNEEGHDHVYP